MIVCAKFPNTASSKALQKFIGLLKDNKIEIFDNDMNINKDDEEGKETDEYPCSRASTFLASVIALLVIELLRFAGCTVTLDDRLTGSCSWR